MEVVELDEPADLAWTSVTGIDQRMGWRPREALAPGSRCGSPTTPRGGLLGTLSERVAAPVVARSPDDTLHNLRKEIEGVQAT